MLKDTRINNFFYMIVGRMHRNIFCSDKRIRVDSRILDIRTSLNVTKRNTLFNVYNLY